MATRYPQAVDGEWIQPRRRNYKLECCDCGLTHRLNFRLVKYVNGGRSIQFQAFREKKETEKARRARGIKITHGTHRNPKSK